jgi:hypothetical protein
MGICETGGATDVGDAPGRFSMLILRRHGTDLTRDTVIGVDNPAFDDIDPWQFGSEPRDSRIAFKTHSTPADSWQ